MYVMQGEMLYVMLEHSVCVIHAYVCDHLRRCSFSVLLLLYASDVL